MTVKVNDVAGFIIAGGMSSRFGSDKRVFEIGGVPLVERTRRLLVALTGNEPFFVGDNLDGLGLDPARIIGDTSPGCGPVGGLVSALDASPNEWCLVIAVDLPCLKPADLDSLLAESRRSLDVLTLSRSGDPEPLAALYHRRTLVFWKKRLGAGELSLVDGIRQLAWKPVILTRGSRALDNLNTPADLNPAHNDRS